MECDLGEICATTIQRNGMISTITKRCKQREACLNEQKQVDWTETFSSSSLFLINCYNQWCRHGVDG